MTGEPDNRLEMAAIQGRLAYEGAAKVPTRVCAIPVDRRQCPMRCIELPVRLKKFCIADPRGGYATTTATAALSAGRTRSRRRGCRLRSASCIISCADAAPGCVSTLLVPLHVNPGMTQIGIKIEQRFAAVPERVGRVREGR